MFRRPAAVVAGLAGQLVALPLIAFGVALAFRLPPVWFMGLMLIACCPGGSSSNVFSMLAKGDVALSVTLTALSSVITLFTIPLVMGFAARFVSVHADAAIDLPAGKLLVQNIVLLFLPMLFGALFRQWRPAARAACTRPAGACGLSGADAAGRGLLRAVCLDDP